MDPIEADERYDRLVATLAETRVLLEAAGESAWSRWAARVLAEVEAHDAHGLRRLLAAYGGMGSINDLVLTRVTGHTVATDEVHGANRTLTRHLATAYDDASALLRDLG